MRVLVSSVQKMRRKKLKHQPFWPLKKLFFEKISNIPTSG
jgi:hypothetical protein